MQVAQALQQARLALVNSDSARLDAELLLGHCLQRERTWLFAHPEQELTEAITTTYLELVRKRAEGHPIAHLLASREFWSLPLKVTVDTLIPRPETECLVEATLKLIPQSTPCEVLELGTGTGAIALALARERPHATITATDIHAGALDVARENAARHDLHEIRFIEADWFKLEQRQRFDVIVSNPPYISLDDEHLQQGDVRFETALALVAADNGLAAIKTIVKGAKDFLQAQGWLLLEHGCQQGESVRELFHDSGFGNVQTGVDHAGLERYTFAQACT